MPKEIWNISKTAILCQMNLKLNRLNILLFYHHHRHPSSVHRVGGLPQLRLS
jgi:hypothetical protein